MPDYRATEAAANAVLTQHRDTIGAALSTLTGETWTVDPPRHGADDLPEGNSRYIGLTRNDGLQISICANTYPRLQIGVSMSYPRDANGKMVSWGDVAPWEYERNARSQAPRINVAATADTARLTREIACRLLPPVRDAWPRFQAALASTATRKDARAATLAMLAADFGADISHIRNDISHIRNDSGCTVYVGHNRCVVDSSGNVEIHRNLSPERAAAVLKLLATME